MIYLLLQDLLFFLSEVCPLFRFLSMTAAEHTRDDERGPWEVNDVSLNFPKTAIGTGFGIGCPVGNGTARRTGTRE